MSISVDDLVASLNSSHIGQEAMDLATLQAQLAKTLFCHTASSSTVASATHRGGTQPSNTPTCRTPSSSFSWERCEGHRARSSSVASIKRRGSVMEERGMEREPQLEIEDEERMVEDLLYPSSPVTANVPSLNSVPPQSSQFPSNSNASALPEFSKYNPSSHTMLGNQMEISPSNPSIFATTDPFYLAQLQASQRSSASSFFANAGRPSTQSPFVMAEQISSSNNHAFAHHVPVVPQGEPHHLFAW